MIFSFSLEQLYLNKNNLKHIFYPSKHPTTGLDDNNVNETSPVPFENLQCLLLGKSQRAYLLNLQPLCFQYVTTNF